MSNKIAWVGIKAAVDEVGQQCPREGGVLSAAFPEPERDLDAVGRDPERDDVRAIGDLQAVEHHHRQANVIQPTRHELPERGAGAIQSDGFAWPQRDGLKWPHLALVDVLLG